jgi:hypothetical protein
MNDSDGTDETPTAPDRAAADDGANADGAAAADESGNFDPQEAAALLAQTRRQAERQFGLHPPLFTLIRAVIILAGYGAVWWSVRHQHPYTGPTGAAIAEIYAAVLISVLMTVTVLKRATSGVSGRSRRQRGTLGAAFATAWIGVGVFQGALLHDGASHGIVYGVFPAAAQPLVVGSALAGMAAAQEDWRTLSLAIAVVALGTGASFAGPVGCWGVMALGGGAIGIGAAAFQLWEHQTSQHQFAQRPVSPRHA